MLSIRFSHDYYKFPVDHWDGTKAVLVAAQFINVDEFKKNYPKFIEYDTRIKNDGEEGEEFYPLEFRDGILLIFIHESGKPFPTIRRHTPGKYEFYHSSILKEFIMKRSIENVNHR